MPSNADTGSPVFSRSDALLLLCAALATVLAAVTSRPGAGSVTAFVCSALAVALLAALVGQSVEQLGGRFGPGPTGVLQSAFGNLPELFISLYALKAGLVAVVQAALIGSILANLLLVLGLSFVVGGLKYGTQTLDSERARRITVMMVLSVAAMVMPSVAHYVHAPAASHENTLSLLDSAVLMALFVVTLPAYLREGGAAGRRARPAGGAGPDLEQRWPVWLAVGLLCLTAVGAALVSNWFVASLEPAMRALDVSQAFAGLVVVAIAGNAVENAVGIKLAAANRSEYAFSVVITSPMQIALVLAPLLVILSQALGLATLTLVFPPMLVIAVALAVVLTAFITFDGESSWTEGAALIGLYAVIASAFWWG